MKIFICCSKHFYDQIPPIRQRLEEMGHAITLPNSYEEPMQEERIKAMKPQEHARWKADMIRLQEPKVRANDAVLVLNFEKNGVPNYIGGATFLEMFKAFELGRKIFLYNPIPEGMLNDEITGFMPLVINGDLDLVREEVEA